ncbi:hypothetical protein RB195_013889 [Necator americanus]|uniref:Uncharacterized protein n=1 Tax=Necator americanus TaxID=51031 RepID=A0ABR1DXU2_NECAM
MGFCKLLSEIHCPIAVVPSVSDIFAMVRGCRPIHLHLYICTLIKGDPYSCTTLHAYYCIVILASPTMSSFPPSACVMLMGNPTLSQSCSVKGSQRCNIKTERKISSSLIACRLRELCDRFEEEEFTLQRCTVGNYNENPANKIAQWFLPRAFFQGFLVTTYDRIAPSESVMDDDIIEDEGDFAELTDPAMHKFRL